MLSIVAATLIAAIPVASPVTSSRPVASRPSFSRRGSIFTARRSALALGPPVVSPVTVTSRRPPVAPLISPARRSTSFVALTTGVALVMLVLLRVG